MNWLVKLITPKNVIGITLAPFGIYLRADRIDDQRLINHESIHWEQQVEMLILPFYVWYVIEWLIKLIEYGKKSYRNLSFEREAKHGQYDQNYLAKRQLYSWFKYI